MLLKKFVRLKEFVKKGIHFSRRKNTKKRMKNIQKVLHSRSSIKT